MHEIIQTICDYRTVKPSRVIEQYGDTIRDLMPELWALRGRQQPPQYHPEGDAWVHTLEVIDRAKELCGYKSAAQLPEIWCALVHDLGKGVTPDHELPHHYNHESLGVPLVQSLGERLNVPAEWIRLGQLCSREHLNVHRFLEMRPHKQADFLSRVGNDIWILGLVSQADAQGRGPELKDKPYPQREAIALGWSQIKDVRELTAQRERDRKAKILREILPGRGNLPTFRKN